MNGRPATGIGKVGTNPEGDALYPVMPNIQMTTLPRPDQPSAPPFCVACAGSQVGPCGM